MDLRRICTDKLLGTSIGLVYLWFGLLKFIPGTTPIVELAQKTIGVVSFQLIPQEWSIWLLACTETILGFLLILNVLRRKVLLITLGHIAFTFTPLFLFPQDAFASSAIGFTLVGQYIFKNVIIVSCLLVLLKIDQQKRSSYCCVPPSATSHG